MLLPSPVRLMLSSKMPGWKITAIQDLTPEDQQVWSKARRSSCPGLAVGNFENGGRGYAIMLIRGGGSKRLQTLVLVVEKGGVYVFRTLDGPTEVRVPLVITKWPPGNYQSAEGDRRIRADFDVIQEEQIEASAVIFYWKAGKYHYMTVLE
jgi:hypothetical protein